MLFMSAMLATASSLSPIDATKLAVDLPNRIDCERSDKLKGDSRLLPPGSEADAFIFSVRPSPEADRNKVRIVRTLDDGRSWIDEARLTRVQWQGWPSFSAHIELEKGWIDLSSDPAHNGKIKLEGIWINDHAPMSVLSGECRFVPEISDGR